jgi:hypothetical protein
LSAALLISITSVTIAFVSLILNLALSHRASVRARKPVLVFVDDPEAGSWMLRNVGNGPALNVLVAQRAEGCWLRPVRAPPLSTNSSFALTWLGRVGDTGLGASYSDFEGRRYTSTLGGEQSRTYDGERLPPWDDDEIRRYWDPGIEFPDPWGERASDFRA